MKTLTQFINEALQTKEYAGIEVRYDGPAEWFVKAPETYSESDIQLYLDDILLPKLPGSESNAGRFFGMNAQYISDRYFEYDSITLSNAENPVVNLEFDSHYDQEVGADTKLAVYQVKNIKFIIVFDKFQLKDVTEDNANEKLNALFINAASNINNKYPIEISLNTSNINVTEV